MNNKMTDIMNKIDTTRDAWNELTKSVTNSRIEDRSLDLAVKESLAQVNELLSDVFSLIQMHAMAGSQSRFN